MQLKEPAMTPLPDFIALWERYRQLGNGPRADLRRVRALDAIADLPAYYRWLGGLPASRAMERFAFVLPFIQHEAEADPLGRQLAKRGISEMRLFQMLRSESPRDLEYLRRLLQQIEPKLDCQRFGRLLYYWGNKSKRQILQDYFTPDTKEQG